MVLTRCRTDVIAKLSPMSQENGLLVCLFTCPFKYHKEVGGNLDGNVFHFVWGSIIVAECEPVTVYFFIKDALCNFLTLTIQVPDLFKGTEDVLTLGRKLCSASLKPNHGCSYFTQTRFFFN